MKHTSLLLAGVAAAVLAATSGYSTAAGPGKGGGAGMGQGGPAAQSEGAAATEQPQSQFKQRHRVGEQETGKKARVEEGGKAGGEATSIAPMEVAPAE